MKPALKISPIALAVFLAFLMLGWRLPGWLGIEAASRLWILRGGLWLLGLVAAILVFFMLKRKAAAKPATPEQASEIDVAISAARERLSAARGKAGAQFGKLPLLLITGPSAAAKTTIVSRSGLSPDLLAGEVMRGDSVAPTAAINVWFAQGNLMLEAGGRVAGDEAQWRRLLKHIQPSRLGAVFSRGAQAPRAAVVCMGCDELLRPGASESVPATAQRLRARLAEAAQQLGIRLPVYVIFTKADRIPYFDDFVRSFTRDEARDVLGATMPVPPAGNVGHYAERESARIAYALQNIFQGLALRRTDVLPRETQDLIRSGAYEFPREFRKVSDLAALFLLELCRPSQLGMSQFLRGFYFTGVRAVLVHDVAGAGEQPLRAASAGSLASDATAVFDPRALQQQAAPRPVPHAGARKVPEWAFLDRVFRDLILRDTVAQSVTAGGSKIMLGRRIVLGATTAALIFFSLGMTWSLFTNMGLLGNTRAAVDNARSLARAGALPELDALQRLEQLRVQAELLNRYEREGNPMRMSWLLYSGDDVQPDVRSLYFQKFYDLLWEPTRARLNSWLALLPEAPAETSSYDATYDALKAYLVTTERPDSSKADFLAPVLTRFWLMGGQADSDRRALAEQQFAFFADELRRGNPFEQQPDGRLVERTRAFLRAFSGEAQLYSYLLAIARDSVRPVRWLDQATVLNDFEVRPEFTVAGWTRAQAALGDLPRLLNREVWVIGEGSKVPEGDRVRIEQGLRQRYAADYAGAWTRFLEAGRVPGVRTVPEAAARLKSLSNNPSPLLRMIGLASTNTAVDTVAVGRAFAPAHTVAAPNVTDPTEAGGKYIAALNGFQVALEQVAASSGSMRDQMQLQASDASRQVRSVVNELAIGFSSSGQAQMVGSAIRTLLLAPVTSAEAALGRVSIDELNSGGPVFCRPFQALGRKYPFAPNATTEAEPGEVSELLAPGTGGMWVFYQDNLQNLLTRSGSRFVIRQGANPAPNPAFRDYFNTLAQISDGFYADNSTNFEILFTLRMETTRDVPEINVTMGRSARYTQTEASGRTFDWDGTPIGARITARIGSQTVTYADIQPSAWWVFRLLAQAQVEPRSADTYRITFRNGPVPISGELKLEEPSSIFHAGQLNRIGSCPTMIAR